MYYLSLHLDAFLLVTSLVANYRKIFCRPSYESITVALIHNNSPSTCCASYNNIVIGKLLASLLPGHLQNFSEVWNIITFLRAWELGRHIKRFCCFIMGRLRSGC